MEQLPTSTEIPDEEIEQQLHERHAKDLRRALLNAKDDSLYSPHTMRGMIARQKVTTRDQVINLRLGMKDSSVHNILHAGRLNFSEIKELVNSTQEVIPLSSQDLHDFFLLSLIPLDSTGATSTHILETNRELFEDYDQYLNMLADRFRKSIVHAMLVEIFKGTQRAYSFFERDFVQIQEGEIDSSEMYPMLDSIIEQMRIHDERLSSLANPTAWKNLYQSVLDITKALSDKTSHNKITTLIRAIDTVITTVHSSGGIASEIFNGFGKNDIYTTIFLMHPNNEVDIIPYAYKSASSEVRDIFRRTRLDYQTNEQDLFPSLLDDRVINMLAQSLYNLNQRGQIIYGYLSLIGREYMENFGVDKGKAFMHKLIDILRTKYGYSFDYTDAISNNDEIFYRKLEHSTEKHYDNNSPGDT